MAQITVDYGDSRKVGVGMCFELLTEYELDTTSAAHTLSISQSIDDYDYIAFCGNKASVYLDDEGKLDYFTPEIAFGGLTFVSKRKFISMISETLVLSYSTGSSGSMKNYVWYSSFVDFHTITVRKNVATSRSIYVYGVKLE